MHVPARIPSFLVFSKVDPFLDPRVHIRFSTLLIAWREELGLGGELSSADQFVPRLRDSMAGLNGFDLIEKPRCILFFAAFRGYSSFCLHELASHSHRLSRAYITHTHTHTHALLLLDAMPSSLEYLVRLWPVFR